MSSGTTGGPCCKTPAVESDYQAKGKIQGPEEHKFKDFDEIYITGKPNGKTAIICVFDIFAYYPQTLQGADILAESTGTIVYMPDFFNKKPYSLSNYLKMAGGDDSLTNGFNEWFGTVAPFDVAQPKLISFANAVKKDTGVSKLGLYGYCWGGQVAMNVSGAETPFSSVAMIHPFGLAEKHGSIPTIPVALYLSKDEVFDQQDNSKKNSTSEAIVTTLKKNGKLADGDYREYPTQDHGFAAARANLLKDDNKTAYQDVYKRLGHFFHTTLA